ncbi:hypothetical protein Fmac_026576 [Flemingia macrophylla]|uniref:Uncharacterized protein n=1 Tax=Flemingia macrophylla TaxID=520843 RepID=A0ABD1LF87_9FABA
MVFLKVIQEKKSECLLIALYAKPMESETCDLRTNPLEGRGDDGKTNAYQTYGKKIPQQGIG